MPTVSAIFQPNATVSDDQALETISLTWEQISGPSPAIFTDVHQLRPTIRFMAPGSYLFKLTAADGNSSATDTVTVNVSRASTTTSLAGLIAYWPFDGSMRDLVGNRNLVSPVPNLIPNFSSEAKSGQSLDLASRNYPFRQVDGPLFDLNGSETGMAVSYWCKLPADPKTSKIFEFTGYTTRADGTPYNPNPGLTAEYSKDFKIVNYGFPLKNSSAWGLSSIPRTTLVGSLGAGTWHHMVINFDKMSQRITTYTDGVLTNLAINDSNNSLVFAKASQGFCVGFSPFSYGSPDWQSLPLNASMFKGKLDEIAIFNRSLTEEEVITLKNATGGLTPPNLNPPPLVDAGPNQTCPLSQSVAQLQGLVTDDDASLTSTWRLQSGPADGVVISNPELPQGIVTFSKAGIYTFELLAVDGYHSVTDTVEFRVAQPCQSAFPTACSSWFKANGDAKDSVGTSDLTWFEQSSIVPGKVGSAFEFVGGSMLRGKVTDLAATPAVSFEGWIKDNSNGQSSQRIFEITASGLTFDSNPLLLKSDITSAANGSKRYLSLSCPTQALDDVPRNYGFDSRSSADSFPLGEYYHLAITLSRTGGVSFFVNGVLLKQAAIPNPLAIPTNPYLKLGGILYSTPANLSIDEFSIYKRALDPAEILAIYQAGSAGKCPPWAQLPANSGFVDAGPSATLPQPASHTFAGVYEANDFAANPTLSWTLTSGPAPVTLTAANTLTPAVALSVPGRYVFQLNVTDGTKSGSDTVLVDLLRAANTAPVITWVPPTTLQLPAETLTFTPRPFHLRVLLQIRL